MFLEKLVIEGSFPERALLRLKREGIGVFHVKKIKKNQILFSVKRKQTEKVFAIYQNVWYNIAEGCPYTLKRVGENTPLRITRILQERIGLFLGSIFFAIACLFSQNYILRIEIVGTNVYQREIYQALEAGGLKLYSRYDEKNNGSVCAEILSLDGISFCTVKKQGVTLIVEVQSNPFSKPKLVEGDMCSLYEGQVVSVCVLRGTALIKAGDEVQKGQTLIGGYFQTQEGGQVRIEAIATVTLSCGYQEEIQAATKEEAFAAAYLSLGETENVRLIKRAVTPTQKGFFVDMQYLITQSINL